MIDENEIEFLWLGGYGAGTAQWLRQEKKTIQFHLIHEQQTHFTMNELIERNERELLNGWMEFNNEAMSANGEKESEWSTKRLARQAKAKTNETAATELWNWLALREFTSFFSFFFSWFHQHQRKSISWMKLWGPVPLLAIHKFHFIDFINPLNLFISAISLSFLNPRSAFINWMAGAQPNPFNLISAS